MYLRLFPIIAILLITGSCRPTSKLYTSVVDQTFGTADESNNANPKGEIPLSYESFERFPVSIVDQTSKTSVKITEAEMKFLSDKLEEQWKYADIKSEQSFDNFLNLNSKGISFFKADAAVIASRSETIKTTNTAEGLDGTVESKRIYVKYYTLKIDFKWHIKDGDNTKTYTTPLHKNLTMVSYEGVGGINFEAKEVLNYYLNYSASLSRRQFKSALVETLSTIEQFDNTLMVLSGESALDNDMIEKYSLSHKLQSEIFESVCKLYFVETGDLRKLNSCEFLAETPDDLDDLGELVDREERDADFISAVEAGLRTLKVRSCEVSKPEAMILNPDKSSNSKRFDLFVKVAKGDKFFENVVYKGRVVSLYQKKGKQSAYRVYKRHAVVDSVVDNSKCELSNTEALNFRCVKAHYTLNARSKTGIKNKCRPMVSGKFFFSIKKDNLISI